MSLRALVAAALLSLPQSLLAQPNFEFHQPVDPPRPVQVVAQRGLWTLAPENSIEAVKECAVDYIEWASVDVRRTKDGQHVVLRDEALSPDGPAHISNLTLEQVRELKIGERFAPRFKHVRPSSLAELLAAVGHDVNLILNCEGADAELLVREITEANLASHVVVAGSPEFLKQVRGAGGSSIARLAQFDPDQMTIDQLIADIDPAVVEFHRDDVTPELCRALHERGIRVQAVVPGWDHAPLWTRLMDAGVDVIRGPPVWVRFIEVRRRIPTFPVQIALHRGANRYAPENTLSAIRMAAGLGADYIEIDIRTTQDGRFVLLHDRTLDRTTTGTGPVSEQPAAAVTALDAGAWFGKTYAGMGVPSLEDGLTVLGEHAHAYLDAKDIAPEALVAAIHEHNLLSRHVVYQSVDYCRRLKELEPNVRLLPPLRKLEDLDQLPDLKPYGVDAAWESLSPELIARCHAAGIRVFSDALGEHETIEDYQRAIGWGIDVIQTDYPLRVLRAIELAAP